MVSRKQKNSFASKDVFFVLEEFCVELSLFYSNDKHKHFKRVRHRITLNCLRPLVQTFCSAGDQRFTRLLRGLNLAKYLCKDGFLGNET